MINHNDYLTALVKTDSINAANLYHYLSNVSMLCRILQQEKRNVLMRQLEEATRITTYLHSQLKRYITHNLNTLIHT